MAGPTTSRASSTTPSPNSTRPPHPPYPSPPYNLGRAYLAKDMLNRARECFQRALEIAPGYELAREALENLRKRVM